ncbi:MAG: alpha/beta hydrolase family protein [Termitinemataceae bacterium]|nr:MAG: alpha/beta hydrolase family protein [Termitinemataceae bacterium]
MILNGSLYSKVLGMHTGISIFTPEQLSKTYRVVYLLHGLHGSNQTWINNTMLAQFAGRFDTIFIMPEVGRSFYCDMTFGYNYKTYICDELPSIVKSIFKISAKRDDTAIIGCSMGGYGALKLSLSKPGQYGFCGAISPACLFLSEQLAGLRKEGASWAAASPENAALLRDMTAIFGQDLRAKAESDPLALAKKAASQKNKAKIFACCGKQDDLLEENRKFNHAIQDLGLDYNFAEWDGKHDWVFFNDALKKALDIWEESFLY